MTIVGHLWGFVLATLALFSAIAAVRAWRCPRCKHRFSGAGLRSWPDQCAFCGLDEYASSDSIASPFETIRNDAVLLSPTLQRLIAAGQIVSGAAAMLLSAIYAREGAWWNIWLLEGIGFASTYAGWRLWRNERDGFTLTRSLQALQLIAIQGSYGVIAFASGFQINMIFDQESVQTSAGILAHANIQPGDFPFRFSFNFLAAFLLIALWGAKPDKKETDQNPIVPNIGNS